MQLPRGTFREIRKGVVIAALLHELESERFSGVANISSQTMTGTLVFKTGKCILVKVHNFRGDAGWEEIQKSSGEEVDAALSLLGDAQVELALEFNKPCRVLKGGKTQAASPRPAAPASPDHSRPVAGPKPAVPVAPLKPAVKPPPTHHHPAPPAHAPVSPPSLFARATVPVPPAPPVQPHAMEAEKKQEDRQQEQDAETSSFEADLDTFDTMDFDNVTDKIRTDCKTMIKQLHLDHLMER